MHSQTLDDDGDSDEDDGDTIDGGNDRMMAAGTSILALSISTSLKSKCCAQCSLFSCTALSGFMTFLKRHPF